MSVAMRSPISRSPFAEMVATSEISYLVLTGFELDLRFLMTCSTARLMPLLRSIGFMPAATDLHPSLKIALARTVAVVVPSPASSLVF